MTTRVDWDALARTGELASWGKKNLAARLGVSPSTVRDARRSRRCAQCDHIFPRVDAVCPECGHIRGEPLEPIGDARPIADIPAGHRVKGVSTLIGADGSTKIQWIKTTEDRDPAERARMVLDAAEVLLEPIRGMAPITPPPPRVLEDHASMYLVGDHHFGMYAWAEETGAPYDLDIASDAFRRAIHHLASLAEPTVEGVLVLLGDTFHADDSSNQTPRSRNALDVDTRQAKVVRTGTLLVRDAILRLLQRHKTVRVYVLQGNHDPHASEALALAMWLYFDSEPRVFVDTTPSYTHRYRFGSNLIGLTHGDTIKPADLPLIMATDWPEDWGACAHRKWYHGHVHHSSVKDFNGCTVETFRTLAAGDAWHRKHGYRAPRSMDLIVHHREHGEVLRHRVGVGQLGIAA